MNVDKLVENCYNALPPTWKAAPWSHLNHGVDVLDSKDKLNAYIAAYGEMHIRKCRIAMQNFPFDNFFTKSKKTGQTIPTKTFEIIDWGCGQGLGTLTFLQMLYERDILECVSRITLIEPSSFAIRRAKDWIHQMINPRTEVICYQRTIPTNNEEEWKDLYTRSHTVINIFSNILDIESIGLGWLANYTSKLADESIYICVGPLYRKGISRITDFHNYFGSPECFTNVALFPCAYTTHTHKPYGVEAKCFIHQRSSGTRNIIELSDQKRVDEYRFGAECYNGVVKETYVGVYHSIANNIPNDFTLFFMPRIGVEKVDFVLTSPTRGIVLLNVCENLSDLRKDYERIEGLKQELFDVYLKSLKINTIVNSSFYNSIKTGLFFTSSTQKEIETKCKEYFEIIKEESKEEETSIDNKNKKKTTDPTAFLIKLTTENCKSQLHNIKSRFFKSEFHEELKGMLFAQWHSFSEGDLSLGLTEYQNKVITNPAPHIHVKGVAGSGKTLTLAYQAVKEHLRTGEKVLIVTYNITLIKYILFRIKQVPADFNILSFEIINYHQFFLSKLKRYGLKREFNMFDNEMFFHVCKDQIIEAGDQYATIIIDEAQDYTKAWINILKSYFLKPNGRVIEFGDDAQNIYKRSRKSDQGKEIIKWTNRLSKRIFNQRILTLVSAFSELYNLSEEKMKGSPELPLFGYHEKYWKLRPGSDAHSLGQNLHWIVNTYKLNRRDVVVLGETIDLLREVEWYYRYYSPREKTMTTFESKEEYEEVKKQNGGTVNILDLKALRRVAKVHFTTDTDAIKFATISSFKGWESKTVILILQPFTKNIEAEDNPQYAIQEHGNEDALIYTGMTRARENLFILNLHNEKYHDFFVKNINNKS